MDKRVEVRCSGEELAQWKVAAGDVPLSRWIRHVLNMRSGSEALAARLDLRERLDRAEAFPTVPVEERVAMVRQFKPDFKGKR